MSEPTRKAGETTEVVTRREHSRYFSEFSLRDTVYVVTHDEKRPGLITGITIRPTGVVYCVSWGDCSETTHYDFELSTEYVPVYT